jgi:Tfp pilus assembly protein PilO
MTPKTILIFVPLILIAIAFLLFGLPQIRSILDLRGKVLEQKSALKVIQGKFESTKDVVGQFQAIRETDRELVASALPMGVDLPNLLVRLETLISSSGLVSEAIEVKRGEEQPGEGVLASSVVNITVLGNYESLKVFLKALEQNLRIFDVETISFAAPALSEGGGDFRFSLSIKTYHQP